MKFLFDHNLSPRLIKRLADLFPDSTHVYLVKLERAADRVVWKYARENNFTIVSKDSDFNDLSELLGFPPKVIWIRRENCSVVEIEKILRNNVAIIQKLDQDNDSAILMLF